MTKQITLIPKYQALATNKRYVLVYGGRGSAKSFHMSMFLTERLRVSGHVILFTRYTMTSAEKSIIPEFLEKLELTNTRNQFKISKTEIEHKKSKSRILFSGIKTSSGNQTAALKGTNGLTNYVLDEAEEMVSPRDFDKIDDSIRKKGAKNQVFLIFNTDKIDHEHWIYKRFFSNGKRSDTEYIHTTYLDNKANLAQSFLDKAARIKKEDPQWYAVNYGGEFPASFDRVFEKGFEVFNEMPDASTLDWEGLGGDFGYSDNPTACVHVMIQGRNLYLKELLYETNLMTHEIASTLIERGYGHHVGFWDSAANILVNELRYNNLNAFPAVKGSYSKPQGLKKLQEFNIFIHEDSLNLQKEWRSYRWDKKPNGEYKRDEKGNKVPVKFDDHLIDATRYATYSVQV